ncbi:glutamate synthase [Hesseltinella vesiculosa]|uniref:Glutamate synthase n=1 Tax=Hesseltinella vesiculosa TaxID=101127 RepID=A0A1X2GFI3_9FUNG|nr:glutamate synthase [Hesseltinella vesiculosa]
MASDTFGDHLEKIYPIIEEGGSDSAAFDNVLELLVVNGALTLPEAVMVMIPEAWQANELMDPDKKAFYQWASHVEEPFDGPALFTFSDGRYVGANLDRNGLRPCRYYITSTDLMICASEVGTVPVDPEIIVSKGRLHPGKMLLVDTHEGRLVDDSELKQSVAQKHPYKEWIKRSICLNTLLNQLHIDPNHMVVDNASIPLEQDTRLIANNYSLEQLNLLMLPMISDGKETLGSMGNDAVLACMDEQPRLIYDYFKQLFAQVTNPPIDPIREQIVMSLSCCVGPFANLLTVGPEQCDRLVLDSPMLTKPQMHAIRSMNKVHSTWNAVTIDITFDRKLGIDGYLPCLDRVCQEASVAIEVGAKVIILSDSAFGQTAGGRVSLSALIAVGGVHHYLVRNKLRGRVALMIETNEAREVHHFCLLLGYGADAICPVLALDIIGKLLQKGAVRNKDLPYEQLVFNYFKAVDNGILKVMSKMGISTLASYKGAQIFEAVGLDATVISRCFAGTSSRIKGATFDLVARDALTLYDRSLLGQQGHNAVQPMTMPETGEYHWRSGGQNHICEPSGMGHLQDAVRQKNKTSYDEYAKNAHDAVARCTLRGLLDFDTSKCRPIPVEQVEPWTAIVKRFVTGAMSYGSISLEAHASIAVAMNSIGGKSNTGEGGEKPERSIPRENGDNLRSAIKQVASGRFGVTAYYLADADELQIKMAQGAKPGEGGELAGGKVSEEIASTRKTTPGIGLISPPPHHDIYSIEDLKQLIYDLKCANPRARVSVKLVSEVGVGIVAAGVAKAKADHILISGHDGGTGASRWTGIKYAGLPWELGLAETHQTLVLNDLRGRVILQTDGQLKTGRDVAIACLLGAEEWGFATTPLIALGCIMMRKCHLNTCPVGIATQDPVLRAKFEGKPEHVVNFFFYLAEELRQIMASLGCRTIHEMVGHAEYLKVKESNLSIKTANLDLSPILTPAHQLRPGVDTVQRHKQQHNLHIRLDNYLKDEAEGVLLGEQSHVAIRANIVNTDRATGTTLSYHISKRFGEKGLANDSIQVQFTGSAGQSFGAFLAPGITFSLEGDANDYVGKGLSGGRLIIYPPKACTFPSDNNIIVGNVCLYGATSGEAYFCGVAAERFCVRNSGAIAVCEGAGDHACEYMTGGRVVILGDTGRNLAAGMSGGIAYVLDRKNQLPEKVNMEMVELESLADAEEIQQVKQWIEAHVNYTGSKVGAEVLQHFDKYVGLFVKIMPIEYRHLLETQRATAQAPAKQTAPAKKPCTHIEDVEDSLLSEQEIQARRARLDKLRGFMKYKRKTDPYRPAASRVNDWKELNKRLSRPELHVQAARCMDCGVPMCQSDSGCPIGNIIPKWNELVYKDDWKDALDRLLMTNNFPEFTGRVCPAPCENSCVLGINEPPVSIKSIEAAIIDHAYEQGWMEPKPPAVRSGKRIAVIGSGPAGLSVADQLNKAGHSITVYDRNDRMGGLLMYGIPNMKLDKNLVQRRLDLMAAEGITFVPNAHVGVNVDARELQKTNDVVVVATGATWPRDLVIPGRSEAKSGVHFAMEFLQANTKSLLDSNLQDGHYLSAKGKDVIVIGGGDTGNDCIGTSLRHGCKSVVNFELLPQPPVDRAPDNPWPQFARVYKVDYGHAEVQAHFGKDPREYCVLSKSFEVNDQGQVTGINTVRVEWTKVDGKWNMQELQDSEQFFKADLVLLSMGFLGPENEVIKQLELTQDPRTNILTTKKSNFATHVPGVFAAGDCRRGQSLVVHGINEGRQCALEVDTYLADVYLKSATDSQQEDYVSALPVTGGILKRRVKKIIVEAKA